MRSLERIYTQYDAEYPDSQCVQDEGDIGDRDSIIYSKTPAEHTAFSIDSTRGGLELRRELKRARPLFCAAAKGGKDHPG